MLTGSMSGAGRLLNITQPAVTRVIAYTEQSLGLHLFERIGTRLVPTNEASILMAAVEKLYDNALQVDELARDLARRPGGTLTIAASPSLATSVMPEVIAQFIKAHPQVHLRYHSTLMSDMVRELTSRQASLALSVLPIEHPEIVSEVLLTAQMVCIMPRDHSLAKDDGPVTLEAIAQYPLVGYDRHIPFGRLIWHAFQAAQIEPQVAMEIPRAELAIAMVKSGAGIALVDEFTARSAGDTLTHRHLSTHIPIQLSLLMSRHEAALSQNVRIFLSILKKYLDSFFR